MPALTYIRLIGFTAGTLLQLFWMVVIVGHRRQRNFERVLFFSCTALFFFYAGSLLNLNSEIHYAEPPTALRTFAVTLLSAGLCFLPALLFHLHLEYAVTRDLLRNRAAKRLALFAAYAPVPYFSLRVYSILATGQGFNFLTPGNSLGQGYGVWLAAIMVVCGAWEIRFARTAEARAERSFHTLLAGLLIGGAGLVGYLHVLGGPSDPALAAVLSTTLGLLSILPFAALIYLVQRFNFLQIGRQKNLVFAISVTFLALLYLSLVRRVGGWLEPVLPPEASASILLFILVIFVEPLQRMLGRYLRETAQREMDLVQRLTTEIQREARQGDMTHLVHFIAGRLKEQFEFADAGLMLLDPAAGKLLYGSSRKEFKENFAIYQGQRPVGTLCVEPHGAMISGETRAALEFLCEQLPGALDLCRLIEEKLRLERDLAERERLALVGQMAASISHNLKNPLGSIKTILQVQLEGSELPDSLRGETKLVLEEIGRLSTKLNQLLQFSRPAVRPDTRAGSCDANLIAEEVTSVLRHEAERRGIALEAVLATDGMIVAAGREALSDIFSNLLINALEATERGGHVGLRLSRDEKNALLSVEDDGPGISPAARERILQPFFTTKTQGTGLGLAIVARRVAESGGRLEWDSPVAGGRGTNFRVWLPMMERANEEMK